MKKNKQETTLIAAHVNTQDLLILKKMNLNISAIVREAIEYNAKKWNKKQS